MARATVGELLAAASERLLRAAHSEEAPVRPSEVAPVAQALSTAMTALARFLDAGGAVSDLGMRRGAPHLTGWPRAVLVARGTLLTGLGALEPYCASPDPDRLRPEIGAVAGELNAAAAALSAARDLMYTHFAPAPGGGGRVCISEWAPVIASESTARALSAEAGAFTRQLATVAARLSQACTDRGGKRLAFAGRRLRSCGRALWSADEVIQEANRREPVRAVDLELLRAIPVNIPHGRGLPGPADPVPVLCDGIMRTAERVRQATWVPSPPWSPAISGTSLRATAAAAVVISHNCATALETLAAVDSRFGPGGFLTRFAGAAAAAREGWLRSAVAWGDSVVTDTTGTRSALSVATSDLAWWTGRLVYADPRWSPSRGRNCAVRRPEELLAPTGTLAPVGGAIHAAAETLCRLAEAEQTHIGAIAAAGRLYVPTRLLPEKIDNPRRYGPAQQEHLDGLLATYAAAHGSSLRLASGIAQLAAEAGAPTRMLTAMRGAIRGPDPSAEDLPPPGPVGRMLRERGVTSPALLLRAASLDKDLGLLTRPGREAGPPG